MSKTPPRTVARQVPECQRSLALDLQARALHEPDQALDELGLALCQPLPVVGVDGNVGERGGAVVLDVGVGALQERDEDRDGAGVDELVPVLVRVRHVEQGAGGVALDAHVLGPRQSGERDQRAALCDLGLVVVWLVGSACARLEALVWGGLPCVARLVMQPTALHWTSTLGLSIWRMSGSRPPSLTIKSLFSAARGSETRFGGSDKETDC